MNEFIITELKLKEKHLYLLVFLSFIIISCYHLSSGLYMSSDSYRFSEWADRLLEFNFNFFDFFSIDKDFHRPHLFFFSLPVLLIALCKVFFISDWQFAFFLLNLLLLFFSLIIFVKCLLLIKIRPVIIALTLPLIIISVDLLIWPRYILSDMIYSFLVVLAIFFIIKGIIKKKICFLELILITFFLLASRPSSIPVIFAIIFFIITSKYQIFLKPKKILQFLLMSIFLMPFVFGLIYLLIEFNFSENDKLGYLINMVKKGMIIHDRPETWVNAPTNFIDVVYVYFLRLLNFFNPYADSFSIIHVIFNLIQLCAVVISILVWLLLGFNEKDQNKIFFFIIVLSFSVAAFHSFTIIDYDWRYRFPIILPLVMLFPISLSMFLNKKIKFKH